MNKAILELKEISKARKFIYGLTIFMIVFYHAGFEINNSFLKFIKSYMDIGVEIFFFMSGVSLYFSYIKTSSPLTFYKRRLVRVMPYYLVFYGIVFIYFNIIKDFNILQFLLNYTMLDFWIHGLGNSPWFLAAIIIFYFIYPLFFKIFFKDNKRVYKIIFMASIVSIMVLLIWLCPHLRIFAFRIPIFFIGCFMGKLVYENKLFTVKHLLMLITSIVVTLIIYIKFKNIIGLNNLLYIPLSFIIVLFMTLLHKLNNICLKLINIIIGFFGGYTLEIYLTHEKVQENLYKILNLFKIELNNAIYNLLSILVALVISISLSFLIKTLINTIYNKKEKKENLNE